MKIAVTGATGFIGSEVIKILSKKKKIKVIATFNKSKIIKKEKKVIYKKLDIYKKKNNFYKYLEFPDILINLSWYGLANYHSSHHINVELKAQKFFIQNLIENGLKNIFISGTCYEYGKINGQLNESMKPKPKNAYAFAKNSLRKYVFLLKKKYTFNLVWARLFYVYGKVKTRKTLYSSILDSYKNKKILEVQGKLIRDYLSVKDLASYIVKLALKKKDIGIINVCSGSGVSLKEIVKKICFIEGINPVIKFIKILKNSYEAKEFWGSNCKLKHYIKK